MSAVLWQRRRLALLSPPFNWHEITEAEFVEQSDNPAFTNNYEYRALEPVAAHGVVDDATVERACAGAASALNDGGPAFPDGSTNEWGNATNSGMSLRDYFAAEELASLGNKTIFDVPEGYARIATHCYRMADAMLKARGDQ